MKRNNIRAFVERNTWLYAAVGSLVMWLAVGIVSNNLNLQSLITNMFSAAFLAMAALGQMLVITSGRGAICLAVPGLLTVGAFMNVNWIANNEAMILPGMLGVVAFGAIVGILLAICVIYLKIPAMIASMAMNYVLSTVSMMFNSAQGHEQLHLTKTLATVARGSVLGVYNVVWIVLAIMVLMQFIIKRTTFGRSLLALGQNYEAAYFAGIRVKTVEILTYVICCVLVALTGMLMASRVGGAFLGMGDDYMLNTVGACVIGGTLISGGKASPIGTVLGALFLTLINTALQLANASLGLQNVITGALIVLVIVLGTPSRKKAMKE